MALFAAVLAFISLLPEGSFVLGEGIAAGRPFRIVVAVLLGASAVAICAALVVQIRSLRRRSRGGSLPRSSGREPAIDVVRAKAALISRGWACRDGADGESLVFTRHAWSRWSGVVLHIGLLLVMAGMSAVLVTESRTEYIVHEGELLDAFTPEYSRFRAPLGPDVTIDGALRLDRVQPVYWASGELRSLDSDFTDVGSGEPVRVSVNSVTRWSGARLFQNRQYGRVFDIRITGPDLQDTVYRVEVESVPLIGTPAYRDLEVPGIPGTVRIRSIETNTPQGVVPVVVLRIEDAGTVLGQAELAEGSAVRIADYEVTLERQTYWQMVVLARQYGDEALMFGTLLVVLSSMSLYLMPAAAIYILADGEQQRLVMSGSRLARTVLKPEIEELLRECS